MFRNGALLVLTSLALGVCSRPAAAADAPDAPPAAIVLTATAVGASNVPRPFAAALVDHGRLQRPATLPVLYASLAAAQAFDAYSTHRGLAAGAREANPLARGGGAAFWTMKAVGTIVPIAIAERMWKTNKAAAIVTMVAANGVMAAIAANNARVLARQSR